MKKQSVVILWALFLALLMGCLFLVLRATPKMDFPSYYFAAKAIGQGNPYDPVFLRELAANENFSGYVYPYLYPPIIALILKPLTGFDFATAQMIWGFLCLASLLGCVWCLKNLRLDGETTAPLESVLTAFLACSLPIVHNINNGQINLFTMLLVSLMIGWMLREKSSFAGVALAGASLIKLTPILFLLLAWHRNTKLQLAILLGTVVGSLSLAYGITGQYFSAFLSSTRSIGFTRIVDENTQPDFYSNIGIGGLVSRVFGLNSATGAIAAYGILFILFAFAMLRKNQVNLSSWAFALALIVLNASPIMWVHHLVILVPFLVWFLVEQKALSGMQRWLLLTALFILGMPWNQVILRCPETLRLTISVLPTAIMLGMIFWLLNRKAAESTDTMTPA